MILRNNWPDRGLKMKMAPLMGLVVRLPAQGREERRVGRRRKEGEMKKPRVELE